MDRAQGIADAISVLSGCPEARFVQRSLVKIGREGSIYDYNALVEDCGCPLGILAREAGVTLEERLKSRTGKPFTCDSPVWDAIEERFAITQYEQLSIMDGFDFAYSIKEGKAIVLDYLATLT